MEPANGSNAPDRRIGGNIFAMNVQIFQVFAYDGDVGWRQTDVNTVQEAEQSMASMVFERHEHVIVACHDRRTPSMAEWDAYLSLGLTSGISADKLCFLIFTAGGSPDAMQRRRMEMAMRMHGVMMAPSAIVTDSWAVRQVVTIISWFNPAIRAFAGHDAKGAMDYLGIEGDLWPTLLQAASRLQLQLGEVSRTS
jgi:hypothetical protein